MIYLKSGTQHILIFNPGNIEEIKKGRPAYSADKEVLVAYAPDLEWLTDRMGEVIDNDGNMNVVRLDELLKEGLKNAPVYDYPYHPKIEFVKGGES